MVKKRHIPEKPLPPEGAYSNFLRVQFNDREFILDFGHKVPDADIVRLHTRIVTSPQHALLMKNLLEKMLLEYKEKFKSPPPSTGFRR